jgi:hypothetical protein
MRIIKYPLEFSDDEKVVTTTDPRNQLFVFFNTPLHSRLIDPHYGIDEDFFLQRTINSISELSSVMMISLRNSFKRYIREATILYGEASFNRSTREVILTIYFLIDGEKKSLSTVVNSLV